MTRQAIFDSLIALTGPVTLTISGRQFEVADSRGYIYLRGPGFSRSESSVERCVDDIVQDALDYELWLLRGRPVGNQYGYCRYEPSNGEIRDALAQLLELGCNASISGNTATVERVYPDYGHYTNKSPEIQRRVRLSIDIVDGTQSVEAVA